MKVSDEKLTHLFKQMKEESSSTQLSSVSGWIVSGAVLKIATAGSVSSKLTLVFTKKIIFMTTTILSVAGIGLGIAVFGAKTTEKSVEKANVISNKSINQKEIIIESKESKIALIPSREIKDPLPSSIINPFNSPLDLISNDLFINKLNPISIFQDQKSVVPSVNITVENFTKLILNSAFEVELKVGTPGYEIIGTEEEKTKAEIIIENGVLKLNVQNSKMNKNCHQLPKVIITMTLLESIEVNGACAVISNEMFTGTKLEINQSGASDLKMQLNYQELSTELNGASEQKLSGTITTLKAEIQGASEAKFDELKVDKADVQLQGASEMTIDVKEELKAKLNGASELKYITKPNSLETEVHGASEIKLKKVKS